MARVYADVNQQMPRAYWDYDSVNITWGVLENYEVVRKIGTLPRPAPLPPPGAAAAPTAIARTLSTSVTVQILIYNFSQILQAVGNTRKCLRVSTSSITKNALSKS